MLNADVHLLLLRPTRVPVAGEGVSEGFQGQVELDGWTWSFHNEDERKKAEERDEKYNKTKMLLESTKSRERRANQELDKRARERRAALKEYRKTLDADKFTSDDDRDAYANKFWKEQADAEKEHLAEMSELETGERPKTRDDLDYEEEQRIREELDRNKNFEFTFSKRVDVATTQLLNSMKAGDVFPTGVMTIHQRSTNAAMSLVFNLQRVRLLDYSLKCETSETLSTMREEWTCEFGALGYVYKSKDMVYLSSSVSQNVPRALTQGQVRAFTMKSTKLAI